MKARTKKTRWLLIALLFGFLATVGLIVTAHHGARTNIAAKVAPTPMHAVLPPPHVVLLGSTDGKHTLLTGVGPIPDDVKTAQTPSNTPQPHQGGQLSTPSDPSLTGGAAPGGDGAVPAGSPNVTGAPNNSPSVATGQPLQAGAGELASNGYVPLDCELPAGCGGVGTTASSRQPTVTAGGMPGAHDSGSVPGDGSGSQTKGSGTPGTPGQGSDPPNEDSSGDPPTIRDPPVASAPELDPATLAGAVTLLLGSLAVLRSRRRVRATR